MHQNGQKTDSVLFSYCLIPLFRPGQCILRQPVLVHSKPLCLPQAPPGVLKNHFCEKTSGVAGAQPKVFLLCPADGGTNRCSAPARPLQDQRPCTSRRYRLLGQRQPGVQPLGRLVAPERPRETPAMHLLLREALPAQPAAPHREPPAADPAHLSTTCGRFRPCSNRRSSRWARPGFPQY